MRAREWPVFTAKQGLLEDRPPFADPTRSPFHFAFISFYDTGLERGETRPGHPPSREGGVTEGVAVTFIAGGSLQFVLGEAALPCHPAPWLP